MGPPVARLAPQAPAGKAVGEMAHGQRPQARGCRHCGKGLEDEAAAFEDVRGFGVKLTATRPFATATSRLR